MTGAIAQLVLGALTAALSLQLPLGTLRLPGSGFFPLALGVLLVLLAAGQLARVLLARRTLAAAPAKPAAPGGAARRVLLFMAVVAVTTAALQAVGYVASSFLLMLGLLKVLGVRWGVAALIAALSAAGAHLLFVQWLKIPMPPGPLGF
jgi:hypothetical protein